MSFFDFNPDHTDWCARNHLCGTAGEHRSDSIRVDLRAVGGAAYGAASLVRVRDADGREYAEIRARVALAPVEPYARRQLHTLLSGLRDLVTRATVAGRPAPRSRRRAA
ncbi:hypothetical protein [Phytohabitans aurantiacus]|uniref:Uncharacterized protein n=1 Tax=Phytohabitans aurantiacus TaxID=3016789 RepID=A0ABQ5QT04_9ACTN|nr:hypothetical protein [Phytohabitans aurantiacus]GLH97132.1 hypothetical protein Pa4123_24070 [Phytohabitans aurantiacus]